MGIANETYARLTREMFADWEQRFLPKQQELLQKASTGELALEQLNRADNAMKGSLRAAMLANDNALGRFGINNQEVSNSDRARQALGIAGAKNAIREHERHRSLGVLSGAAIGLRDKITVGGGM
ncbi:hypothetical protein IHC87_17365 [Photobacterium damselae subsp. damselae]|uniref:hypothetical protein n=1 Tax=Photobacterium damselae TaxID=38293 RepID=UPI001F491323|nr:hypothetical protein [Photobacterium damselae]UJZ96337.1 hypothetical protein IHC87_17365 [Photobacterium damselae subsp. damselae]UJZ99759.1 hypothetical protein IHC88_20130 [Photobacterium damselae subsp. damselae]